MNAFLALVKKKNSLVVVTTQAVLGSLSLPAPVTHDVIIEMTKQSCPIIMRGMCQVLQWG